MRAIGLTGRVNIVNAFNSGMREDLALYGNELNYAQCRSSSRCNSPNETHPSDG